MLEALFFLLTYSCALALVFKVAGARQRRSISSWLPPVSLIVLLLSGGFFSAYERLFLGTVFLLILVKCAAALKRPYEEIQTFSRLGLLFYFSIWPGIDLSGFQKRESLDFALQQRKADAPALFRGAAFFVGGVALLGALIWNASELNQALLGFGAIVGFLCTVHFGISEILPWMMHQLGFRVGPLFRAPLASRDLNDFWSRRWNLPFVEMDKILFLRPLRQKLGARGAIFGVFAISGIYHEAGISFPAGGGWGGPLFYFLLHGALVTVVAHKIPTGVFARIFAWLTILGPIALLFHAPFREVLIVPAILSASEIAHRQNFEWYLSAALWLGSFGHFCILGASFQVPKRLNWREDFASLSNFNRKVFWTYGAFIVLCIVSFGILSAILHNELLRGDKAAIAISMFIGAFWTARVGTDLFYFSHEDWPRGWQFELGHVLLTFVFSALAILFGIVVPLCAWI